MLIRPATAVHSTVIPAAMSTNIAARDTASSSMSRCRIIVLSGPSGGGKSTILTRAMQSHPNTFAFSVSHTTRKPRAGEENGTHYWFVTREEIDRMIANNEFLEYATFGGNTYGTSKKAVEDVGKHGRICVLDLELQGVRSIKASHLQAKYILIRPPSIAVLEERLKLRGSETEESLKKRLLHAEEDLEAVKKNPSLFDHVIVNDDLEKAYNDFLVALREDLADQLKNNHH